MFSPVLLEMIFNSEMHNSIIHRRFKGKNQREAETFMDRELKEQAGWFRD